MYPTKEEVKELLKDYNSVPVCMDVLADNITPIGIFQSLNNLEVSFILESVENSNWGKYSFIGLNTTKELRIKNNISTLIDASGSHKQSISNLSNYINEQLIKTKAPQLSNMPKFNGGYIGYFSYDLARYNESILQINKDDDIGMLDTHLYYFDQIIAYNHTNNHINIIHNINKEDDLDISYSYAYKHSIEVLNNITSYICKDKVIKNEDMQVISNTNYLEFENKVNICKEYIKAGDIFQVVISQRFEVKNPPNPLLVYRELRASNPSPYLYYLKNKEYEIVGASPEMLVNVTKGVITNKPIAGTCKRGNNIEEDNILSNKLLKDPKECAEHTMLVDLGRNDVGRVSKLGSVEVVNFKQVEKFSNLMHLVSNVKGLLRDDLTCIDALLSMLPAGTLSGAPKIRAMQIIDELEVNKRGLYGGCIGYLDNDGSMDSCIAIRTVLYKNGVAYIQSGAGIVADSIAINEYEETIRKADSILNVMRKVGTNNDNNN